CRFCLLSYSTLPPRYVPFHIMLKNLEGLDTTDLPLGLVGSSILDHPEIDYIIDEIGARFERVTVSSLKIDRRKFETLRKLKFKGLKTITIAPETGTYKLRKKINKNIRDQEIKEFIKMVNDLKFDTVKMYFIVGLPEEEDEDVEAINDIMAFSRKNFRGKISVTVSIFVPKPHTPFQYRPFPLRNTIRKRMQLLKPPKGVILHRGSYQGALNQTLFSRGDERLGHALLKALEEEKPFKSFLRVENYLFNEEFIQNLPFNLIDTGIDSNFLVREDLKASKEKITPPCDLDGRCKLCGICSD
ncbi:MAG: radical SAM protein, partial [Candidatus Hydrothermae bacterium]|nr:radical SAM protein [Candidatus Hydrothermae bacterium]